MPKILEFDENARRSLERGVDALANVLPANRLKMTTTPPMTNVPAVCAARWPS